MGVFVTSLTSLRGRKKWESEDSDKNGRTKNKTSLKDKNSGEEEWKILRRLETLKQNKPR